MPCTSALHLRPPFRADHVGSLLRSSALYEKRHLFEKGKCSVEELKLAEDEAIRDVVDLQRKAGMKTITDGELRRSMFFEGVFENLEGMQYIPNREFALMTSRYIPHIEMMYDAGILEAESVYCNGKIRRAKPFHVDEFKFLKTLVAPEEVKFLKVTMCAPSWFHQRHGSDHTYDLSVYRNDDEYFDDIGQAYRAEIKELYYLGCRHIQIDDPTFCYFCNDRMIAQMEATGVDHEALLDTYIRAINICTAERPNDLTISVHMCRGNFRGGMHFTEGSYARIAAKLFRELDVDTYYLEYDTPRAGDFTPLKYLPLDKVVVLGLVTTKSPKLESMKGLKSRINEAVDVLCHGIPKRSRNIALRQLCVSPQCGFASVWQGNPLTEDDELRKLTLVTEIARQVWEDAC
ncbi:UROD/MetE-like protein [Macrolepiota fuliginosa MF-IS2]|uniref:UROD/MetE-like protein n=1 Tax=Macrolepiota fuliginosa MF-IS2 TaxID=1400762 RepID=A0A9P5XR92_9AGAR|nr:UROD/MetE-like protein [Macrolepiota fuliginosa MF-IS2]